MLTTIISSSTLTKTITLLPPTPSSASSSTVQGLPSHSQLQTWVQRPQSVVKCSIADVYAMPSLVPADVDSTTYLARDVYMHGKWPCRMVEIVAWVAGVDHKESKMVVTLDDGNGETVLPVTVELRKRSAAPAVRYTSASAPVQPSEQAGEPARRFFVSARERKAQRKTAAADVQKVAEQSRKVKMMMSTYEQLDLRVGDMVRIVGRIEQWTRRRPDGSADVVRQVVVADGSGGSIAVVDSDQQYVHAHAARDLFASTYSQPFEIPTITVQPSLPPSPAKSQLLSESIDPSSEVGSVIEEELDLKLRDPSKLRPSQLTDSTFRQYLLDHMTQEVVSAIQSSTNLQMDLAELFPEYCDMRRRLDKGKQRADRPFRSSTRHNLSDIQKTDQLGLNLCGPSLCSIKPFTLPSILLVPHLAQLASLVVETETRREEKRRRRRIRDGQARPKDLEVERDRQRRGKDPTDWKLTDEEREAKMLRLVGWVIRFAAEDGQVVQVTLARSPGAVVLDDDLPRQKKSRNKVETCGYLAVPPDLLLPLLCEIIRAEQDIRSRTFMRKTDPRRGHGMFLEAILDELQHCGTEGRWERVREWVVEDGIRLGVARGILRQEGSGWWLVESS